MGSAAAAVTMAMPKPSITNQRRPLLAGSDAFFNPMMPSHIPKIRLGKSSSQLKVRASSSSSNNREKAVVGLTAAAVAAALVLPDIAEAAQPGISPSLKNFLLSIVSGGVVLSVIIGVVVGVSNFDPVKRT